MYDHAQSPRLGQRLAPEFPGIQKFTGDEIPEVGYDGQLIYREDRQVIQVYNEQVGAWEDAIGGIQGQYTYVQATAPVAGNLNDLWWDTSVTPRVLKYWDGDSWEPIELGYVEPEQISDLVANYVTQYAISTSETVAPSGGWSTTAPTRDPGTYIWYRVVVTRFDNSTSITDPALLTGNDGAQGEQGPQGPQGSQGIPGPPGEDGQTLYTWLKYADSPTTGMSDLPTGKTYMGIAYNKTSATESSNYGDYQWSLIQGPQGPQGNQGVQGPPGDDGESLYTWIKYADDINGNGMSDSPVGKEYIGLAYNKTTATESSTPTDYQWALIQGPQGPEGSQGIQGPPGADGSSLYTWLKYADSPTTGMSDSPVGKTYIGLAYNKTSSTESSNYGDYTWSLIQGPQGPQGNQGVQGPPGDDGESLYTWVKYADNISGGGMSDSPVGKTYIGLAYNKTTATESTTPGDYQWALIQGPQGPQGSQGIQGPPGADGSSLYTWLKYADTPTTGMSDSPVGKTYMGLAYNKTSAAESTNYGDYTWSLIQGPEGPQGDQGIPGPPGVDGTTTYTWVKYADNSSGGGMSDSPVGKTYIGLAFNKTTATESATPGDYQWSLIQGPQGNAGAQGVSVTAVTPYFAQLPRTDPAPAKPTAATPPDPPWKLTEPAYAPNTSLYRTEKITFSSGSPGYSYTNVTKVASYEASVDTLGPTAPPAAAPTVEVFPGSGSAVVRWNHLDDATEYDLHVHPGVPGATENDPNTPPVSAPSAQTLHTPNASSPMWVSYVDPQGTIPITTEEGKEAYFAVVPKNEHGAGPATSWIPGNAGPINDQVLSVSVGIIREVIAQVVQTQGLEIGGQTWNNDTGLTIPNVLNFPPGAGLDASILAHLVARSLTVLGNLSIRGTNNEIAKGTTLTMERGMTPPKAGPKFSASTDIRNTHGGFTPRGFAYHAASNRFWRTESIYGAVLQSLTDNTSTGGGYEFGWSNTDLSLQRSEITSGRGGVAFIGNHAYVLCETTEGWSGTYIARYYIYKFAWQGWGVPDPDNRWAYVTRWPYLTDANGNVIKHSPYHPHIGTDGTNLYVVRAASPGGVWVTAYDTSGNNLWMRNLRQAGNNDSVPVYENPADCLGVVVGPADSGGAVGLWARFKGDEYVRAFDAIGSATYGNRLSAWDFNIPLDSHIIGSGLDWHDGRFLAASEKKVARMSKIAGGTIEATQSWRRGNPAAAETGQSPIASYTPVPRQWLKVESSAPIPDDTGDPTDADSVSFYVGVAGGTRYLVLPSTPVGGISQVLDAVPTTGSTAPAPFGFVAGSASRFISAGADLLGDPTIEFLGSGQGRAGPLEWDDLGELSGVSGWKPYTPAWTASSTNPTIGNGTLTGRYMRIGSLIFGSVEFLMGSTTSNGQGQYAIGLPVAADHGPFAAIGTCYFNDASAGYYSGVVRLSSTTDDRVIVAFGSQDWRHNQPIAHASGDRISLSFSYKAL